MFNELKETTYSPLSSKTTYKASIEGNSVVIKSSIDHILKVTALITEDTLLLSVSESNTKDFSSLLLVAIEYVLGHKSELKFVKIEKYNGQQYPFTLFKTPVISRSEFFQLASPWHKHSHIEISPERWTETNGRAHPVRDLPHDGTVYKRYVPEIGKTVSFRQLNIETDLVTFHEWHNQPRVLNFWELNKPMAELKDYLEKSLKDPHQFPMIVEFDGEMVGYYEMYWVQEDRLGPYYDSEAWDRGFHFLIGNTKYLGYANTDTIIKSGLHFLFLDDPRTRKVMAEPRHDNHKVLRYAEASKGWKRLKEFDFPHKRAALLECRREGFFGGNAL